jgi:hypothetical protein
VLVSAEFSKEVTTSVLWLNEHGLDIRCVRLRPYALDDRVILDVQQIIPLPEADSYTVQLKKKAEENRQGKREKDLTRFNLTVDGMESIALPKRRLAFEVVKVAIAKGFSPEQIAALVPSRKWISVDGEVTAEEFQIEASKLQGKYGGNLDLDRYFCDDGDLFRVGGRTYALSNQWGTDTIPVVDEMIAKLPSGSLSYTKAVEPN